MIRAVALLALLPGIAAAQSPCGPAYGPGVPLAAEVSGPRAWGAENAQPIPGGLRVSFPAGSINPGNPRAPRGGAGFLRPLPPGAEARCLSYVVRFEEGFAFARGGKLPGLYGGQAPSGCTAAELSRGFSARLMWREGGVGELYLYAPDRRARCGESIGRGSFRLVPGTTHVLAQEVVLNRPGAADGAIRLWLDGRPVLEATGLTLREDASVRVEGLFFSTFFGGADPSWASPRTQWAEFTRLAIHDPRAAR